MPVTLTPFQTRDNGPQAPLLDNSDATSGCRVAGKLAVVLLAVLCLAVRGWAQEPAVHYWHQGVMPPGAIGSRQLQRGGPLAGFFQPVEIKAPPGVSISLAVANQFGPPQQAPRRVGLLIGSVYRLRVTNIPLPQAEGMEIFPTIEIIDRTYAPADQQVRFAIPVEIAPARHRAGPARQVRHAGDLPGRSAQRLADAQQRAANRGSTWRRAAIRWQWPTSWAGRWRSSAWAPACRTRDRTPTFTLARRPGWRIRRARPRQAKPVRETAPARPAAPAEKKPQP